MTHRLSCLILFSMLLVGCGEPGPPMGTVRGKVTIGGSPPPEPILVFYINSTIGHGGLSTTQEDGSYAIDTPFKVGEYTIYFQKIVNSDGPVSTAQEQLTIVPKEYGNEMTSPLKKTLEEGDNEINIDVPKA